MRHVLHDHAIVDRICVACSHAADVPVQHVIAVGVVAEELRACCVVILEAAIERHVYAWAAIASVEILERIGPVRSRLFWLSDHAQNAVDIEFEIVMNVVIARVVACMRLVLCLDRYAATGGLFPLFDAVRSSEQLRWGGGLERMR